jgi:hypothetical protein
MNEFLAILGIFLFLFVVVGIGLYVVFAYAFYKMAINAGQENPWMAWIPILQLHIMGKMIKTLKISTYQIPSIELVLPAAALLAMVLNRVAVLGTLASLANFILFMFALNKLYKMYKPEQATLYTILSIFALPVPFIFMSLKDLKPMDIAD